MSLACLGYVSATLFLASPEAFAARRRCGSCFSNPNLQALGAQNGARAGSPFQNGAINNRFRNRLNEVQGFSNLLTDGKNIFERTLIPQGRIRVEVVRQLFIGGSGQLLNSVDPLTRTQVRDLYLKNFQKFQGGAKQLVARFLAANGAQDAFLGNLRVAIKGGILPPGVKLTSPKYANYSPEVVNAAGLAFAINLISNARNPIPIKAQNMFADGTIRMNLGGAVDAAGLARLLNDNPYDCDKRGIARADWLVTKVLDPDIYYQITGLSANQDEFADQVGFIDDKKARRGGLLLAAGTRDKPESIVGRNPQRVLQWQPRRNSRGFDGRDRYCFRSHDFTQDPVPGVEEVSRDVFQTGVNFTADAGEWICQRSNGFPIYYLSDEKNRNRANNAPAEIALEAGGGRVGVAEKCIKCHINGFHGGRTRNTRKGGEEAKPYTDHFARIPAALGQEFFSANADFSSGQEVARFNDGNVGRDYPAAAIAASAIQDDAMQRAGAYLEDPDWKKENQVNPLVKVRGLPVVSDLAEEYRKDLTVERQAQELGTSVETVIALAAAKLKMTLPQYKQKWPNGQSIPRTKFAASYCILVGQVRGGQFAPQQRNPATPAAAAHDPAATEESPTRPPAQ